MHDYNTIVGVISLRNDKVSYPVIRQRYGIGNSGTDPIMNRYKESGLPWKDFLKLEPSQIPPIVVGTSCDAVCFMCGLGSR